MPTNERLFNDAVRRILGDNPLPLREDGQSQSVISPYHPDNNREHRYANNSYTFQQRSMKLNLTLGWELEANHIPNVWPSGVKHIQDNSVDGDGAEFVVMPAVTKSPRYVLGLLKELVHRPRLNTNESCGFHMHVSASNLASAARMKQWAIATEHLALQIEDLAFRAVPDSRKSNSYCRRINPTQSGTTFVSNKYSNDRRYHWLNIVEMFRPGGIKTIEIRLLGHTHRWKYLLAWSLFCMELARRGWDVSNRPFEVSPHVDVLREMLIKIEKEIKPLSKKTEPIPQWVYNGLANFGIDANSWDRPLARLSEIETDLRGLVPIPYTDEQPEEEMSHNEDECECGCGEAGRCQSQMHNDSECDRDYCEYCHSDGNCNGSPACESCRQNRHDEGEDCGRRGCGTCHPSARPTVTPRAVRPITSVDPIDMNGVTTGRTMQAEVNALRSVTVDNVNMQVNQAIPHGTCIAQTVWYDEGVNVPTSVLPTLPEELTLPMTDGERLASDRRERTYNPPEAGRRALTVAEIEWLNNQMGR